MPIYDLTAPITPDSQVFPGDPSFQSDKVQSLEQGDAYNLCHLHLSNHIGTHIDFPAHVIKGGKTSSDFLMASLIGPGVILECEYPSVITQSFIQQKKQEIIGKEIVFFKSSEYIETLAAETLTHLGVKIVGVDGLSIDPIEAEDLPAHHILLSDDILIVEGLNLQDVSSGEGEITIAPLNIPDMDGLPARVIMRREDP